MAAEQRKLLEQLMGGKLSFFFSLLKLPSTNALSWHKSFFSQRTSLLVLVHTRATLSSLSQTPKSAGRIWSARVPTISSPIPSRILAHVRRCIARAWRQSTRQRPQPRKQNGVSTMTTCAICKSTLMTAIGGLMPRSDGWRKLRMRSDRQIISWVWTGTVNFVCYSSGQVIAY